MGRKRKRRDERRQARRERGWQRPPFVGIESEASADDFAALLAGIDRRAAARRVCGECVEFVDNADIGRGSCLHPASGVLSPWTDTPACDLFAARRRFRPVAPWVSPTT